MDTIEVPLGEYLRALALMTLAFLALLTPVSLLSRPPDWVAAEAKAIAAARAAATASAHMTLEDSRLAVGQAGVEGNRTGSRASPDASGPGPAADGSENFVIDQVTDDRIGPGMVAGTAYDALNGAPLPDVRVKVQSAGRLAVSNPSGRYNLRNIPAGRYELAVSRNGYLPLTETIEVNGTGTDGINFILSPLLTEGQYRMVLSWNETPKDLDAHLWYPPNRANHLYYPAESRASLDGSGKLDIDAKNGRGPETVTVDRLFAGTYVYAVHQYSSDGSLSESGAYVRVYHGAGLLQTLTPPPGGGTWWTVFTLDGATGELRLINRITSTSPAPYPFP